MPDENGNGRVTMARLDERLGALQGDVTEVKALVRQVCQDEAQARAREAEERRALEARVAANERDIARQDERLKIVGGANAVWSAIAAAASGILATLKTG